MESSGIKWNHVEIIWNRGLNGCDSVSIRDLQTIKILKTELFESKIAATRDFARPNRKK